MVASFNPALAGRPQIRLKAAESRLLTALASKAAVTRLPFVSPFDTQSHQTIYRAQPLQPLLGGRALSEGEKQALGKVSCRLTSRFSGQWGTH